MQNDAILHVNSSLWYIMLIILFLILTVIYYHLKLSIKDGIIIHDPTIATTATNVFFLRDDILEKHSACSFAVFLILLIPRCSVLCFDSIVIITLVFCLYAITVYHSKKYQCISEYPPKIFYDSVWYSFRCLQNIHIYAWRGFNYYR